MSRIEELYQDIILEHGQNPRNFGKMEKFTYSAKVENPVCGDSYRVYLKTNKDTVETLSFEGEGCLISKASGSLMSEVLQDRTIKEARALFRHFQKLVRGETFDEKRVGKLAAFYGLYKFPLRIKCALLPWYAFEKMFSMH